MSIEVRVPTLGESVTEATVATWFKKPGDAVEADEMLCELETDKVTVEVPSPAAGTLGEIVAAEGETVGVDALLATLEARRRGRGRRACGSPGRRPKPAAAGRPPAGGATVDVMVPALGESVTEATVSTWFKKPGDAVAADEMLCELETDKVSVEVPAPAAGRACARSWPSEGATVEAGGKLAVMTGGAGGAAKAGQGGGRRRRRPPRPPQAQRTSKTRRRRRRRWPRPGSTPAQVQGTGRDGRIMKDDVRQGRGRRRLCGAAPPSSAPAAAPARPGPGRGRRARGAGQDDPPAPDHRPPPEGRAEHRRDPDHLQRGGHVGGDGAAQRVQGPSSRRSTACTLGFMSFFTKACVHALKEVPEVNAEIDGNDIVYKNFVHMGVAAGTPQGLVVPVIRDADQMSFAAIEKAIAEMGASAPRRQADDGRDAGRHVHHLQRRRLRLADVVADPEPAAVGHPRHAQDPGPPGGGERRDRDPPDDVSGAVAMTTGSSTARAR